MPIPDLLGVFGVLLILIAYARSHNRADGPKQVPALLLNLAGAILILVSLYFEFNLSAVLMEGAWALVAVVGLVRLALRR